MKTATETRETDLMIIQTVFKNRKRFAFATLVACEQMLNSFRKFLKQIR